MTNEVKFWMVWSPEGSPPRYKHPTRANAEVEAKRLALANPRRRFFVLKAMTGFTVTPVVTMPTEPERIALIPDDIIPF